MTESLRPVRAVAAWVIVIFVGLTEAITLLGWIAGTKQDGRFDASYYAFPPSFTVVLLPVVAVMITGVVTPRSALARPIAMIAFIEYGVLLLWSVFALVRLVRLPGPELPYLPAYSAQSAYVTIAGAVAIAGVGAVISWRVYSALDTLTNEIDELQEQIDELDDQNS